MSTFQTVLLAVFGFMLVFGTLLFSGIIPGFRDPSGGAGGLVVMWGTFPNEVMDPFVNFVNDTYGNLYTLRYVEQDPETFERDFVEALASGKGPDLIILPHDMLYAAENKLLPISYQTVPLRDFQDTYIDQASLLTTPKGLLGVPLFVDPLLLYYNKNILATAGLPNPPELWTEFVNPQNNIVDAMTITDERNVIKQSAIAMGETNNIRNLKDILSMLIIQAGNPLTAREAETGKLQIQFQETFGFSERPAVAAVDFFTQFSNPSKLTYSWNSSLPNSQDAFSAGTLGLYLGRASEYTLVKSKNPHLNFDVTLPPQRTKLDRRTFGMLYSVSVVRSTKKAPVATQAAITLGSKESATALLTNTKLPSTRKDVIALGSSNPSMALFNRAALISRGWLDPDRAETTNIMTAMLRDVLSGQAPASGAVSKAQAQMEQLIPR